MDDIELPENGSGVGGQDHLLKVVDDNLVAAVGAKRGLDSGGNGTAGVDVSQDGAIFGIIAGDGPRMLAKLDAAGC